MLNILILGSSGLLGSQVLKYFTSEHCSDFSVRHTTRSGDSGSIAFTVKDTPVAELKEHVKWADYVINCIGVINTQVDANVQDGVYVNSLFPHIMSGMCNSLDSKFIHISTDCVFSGKVGEYTELSAHDAETPYGKSKSLGEPDDCMVLRTSIIGVQDRENPSLIGWLKTQQGRKINGYTNHTWNGVTTRTYANICEQIMRNELYENGLFHVFSPKDVTKCQLVKMISRFLGFNIGVSDYECEKPVYRTLRTCKDLCKKLYIPDIEVQIGMML